MTPHHPALDPLERAARRRMLLDHLIENPDDEVARRQLTDLVGERAAATPPALMGALALVAVTCAVLSVVCLLTDMDVTAALLAVAGLYAVWIIRRRRRHR